MKKEKSLIHPFLPIVVILFIFKICVIWGFLLYFTLRFSSSPSQVSQVCFSTDCLQVDLALTPVEQRKGLSGKATLAEHQGMLFVFELEGYYPIRMSDVAFPLEVFWLDKEWRIVDIQQAEPCMSYECPQYVPRSVAKYILEAPVGVQERWGAIIGSSLDIHQEGK